MKIILPSLLIICLAAQWALGQTAPNSPDRQFQLPVDPATATLAPTDRPASDADVAVQRVAAALSQHRSISARVRYRVDLFGHQLVGEGIYWQQGGGDDLQMRLELKTVVGQRVVVFLQICDGKYLWQFQDGAEKPAGDTSQKPQIARVDIAAVRQGLANRSGQPGPRLPTLATNELAFGGLPKLVDGLKRSFSYSRVEAANLESLPVWIITGTWRPEALAGISKELADQAAAGQPLDLRKLPPQMPEVVRLTVGQDDLFPYRIEYLRRTAKQGRAGDPNAELLPIVTVEFYEAQLDGQTPIDPSIFVCQPGNADVLDTTQSFLKNLKAK